MGWIGGLRGVVGGGRKVGGKGVGGDCMVRMYFKDGVIMQGGAVTESSESEIIQFAICVFFLLK